MTYEIEIGRGKRGRRAYSLDDIAMVPNRRTRDPKDVSVSWELDERPGAGDRVSAARSFLGVGRSARPARKSACPGRRRAGMSPSPIPLQGDRRIAEEPDELAELPARGRVQDVDVDRPVAVDDGNRVAVIGLGIMAIDAATQAKPTGADEVSIVYRRTYDEKPCTDVELNIAKLDGCNIIWLAAPKEIIGNNGNVKQLVCSSMKLGEPDASGRRSPVDSGETFTLEVDMVIKAAGQVPFTGLVNETGLENTNGKLLVTNKTGTDIPGVFAGGEGSERW